MSRILLKKRVFNPTGNIVGSFDAIDLEPVDLVYKDDNSIQVGKSGGGDTKKVPDPIDNNPLKRIYDYTKSTPNEFKPHDNEPPRRDNPNQGDMQKQIGNSGNGGSGSGGSGDNPNDNNETQKANKPLPTDGNNNQSDNGNNSQGNSNSGAGNSDNSVGNNSSSTRNSNSSNNPSDSNNGSNAGDSNNNNSSNGNGNSDNVGNSSNSGSNSDGNGSDGNSNSDTPTNSQAGSENGQNGTPSNQDGNGNTGNNVGSTSSGNGSNGEENNNGSSSNGANSTTDNDANVNNNTGTTGNSGTSGSNGDNQTTDVTGASAGTGDSNVNNNNGNSSNVGNSGNNQNTDGADSNTGSNGNTGNNSSNTGNNVGNDNIGNTDNNNSSNNGDANNNNNNLNNNNGNGNNNNNNGKQGIYGDNPKSNTSNSNGLGKLISGLNGHKTDIERALEKEEREDNRKSLERQKNETPMTKDAEKNLLKKTLRGVAKGSNDSTNGNKGVSEDTPDKKGAGTGNGGTLGSELLGNLGAGSLVSAFKNSSLENDWRKRLNRLLDKALGTDIIYNPNLINKRVKDAPPGREDFIPKFKTMAILMDCSSSMGYEAFKRVIDYLSAMFKAKNLSNVDFWISLFGDVNLLEQALDLTKKVKGKNVTTYLREHSASAGGTNIYWNLLALTRKCRRPELLIILTDGEIYDAKNVARNPTLESYIKRNRKKIIWIFPRLSDMTSSRSYINKIDPHCIADKRYITFK